MLHVKNVLKKLDVFAEQALGVIGLVGILVITANAFCRFVLKVPMSWSDELLRTIMIYGYFIGAALMFCHGDCMRLEIVDNALKNHKTAHRILNIVLAVVNAAFFGLMGYYVFQMVVQYIADGTTQSTSSTPAWILPFGCALGMLIIAVAAVVNFIKEVSPRKD